MIRTRSSLAAVLLLSAACTVAPTVTPQPLAGPAPRCILIAPLPMPTEATTGAQRMLLVGAEAALLARGYRVVPMALGNDVLRKQGVQPGDAAAGMDRVQATTGADAILLVRALHFDAEQGSRGLESADYEVGWRLVGVDGTLLWHQDLAGSYQRPLDSAWVEPRRGTEAPEVQPIGQPLPQRPFADVGELIAALHRAAFARLPEARP